MHDSIILNRKGGTAHELNDSKIDDLDDVVEPAKDTESHQILLFELQGRPHNVIIRIISLSLLSKSVYHENTRADRFQVNEADSQKQKCHHYPHETTYA